MNSFRPLIYLSDDANATRCFCRGSGLVQVVLSVAIPGPDTSATRVLRQLVRLCPTPSWARYPRPSGANGPHSGIAAIRSQRAGEQMELGDIRLCSVPLRLATVYW
jgi:hypothetical protein